MSVFCYKKIDPSKRLGQCLKEAREALGFSDVEIAQKTHIPLNYIHAIESGEFIKLPKTRAFRRAYIKEYALAVGLPARASLDQFAGENGYNGIEERHPHKQISFFPFVSISIALRNGFVLGVVALFSGYLIWQVKGVLEPPKLAVFAPIEGEVVGVISLPLEGQTEPEASLLVNGQSVMVNEAGHFSTKIDLATGLNTLTIKALKKHGKSTTIIRHVVVREQKMPKQVSLGEENNNTY